MRGLLFQEGSARSVTRSETYKVIDDGTPSSRTSTLYISLCGFQVEATISGDGLCDWQKDLNTKAINHSNSQNYRFKHFRVDWDTHRKNRNQVADLAEMVEDFLSDRIDDWDVVIVGHSRGGIFAHELSTKLAGKSHIDNLHIYLLDPTAATVLHDIYTRDQPKSHSSGTASLYYDNEEFIDIEDAGVLGDCALGTVSDRTIQGYASKVLDYGHAMLRSQMNGLTTLLSALIKRL